MNTLSELGKEQAHVITALLAKLMRLRDPHTYSFVQDLKSVMKQELIAQNDFDVTVIFEKIYWGMKDDPRRPFEYQYFEGLLMSSELNPVHM